MAMAVTAYAFIDNVESGGDGLKLGFYLVQAARIAQRRVKKSCQDENGKFDMMEK
jgi:hypothetical protein